MHREWLWALVTRILPHVDCQEIKLLVHVESYIVYITVYSFIVFIARACVCCCAFLKLLENNGTN